MRHPSTAYRLGLGFLTAVSQHGNTATAHPSVGIRFRPLSDAWQVLAWAACHPAGLSIVSPSSVSEVYRGLATACNNGAAVGDACSADPAAAAKRAADSAAALRRQGSKARRRAQHELRLLSPGISLPTHAPAPPNRGSITSPPPPRSTPPCTRRSPKPPLLPPTHTGTSLDDGIDLELPESHADSTATSLASHLLESSLSGQLDAGPVTPAAGHRPALQPKPTTTNPAVESHLTNRICSAANSAQLLHICRTQHLSFNCLHVSAAINMTGKLSDEKSPAGRAASVELLDELAPALSRTCEQMDARQLANVLWAFAKVGYRPQQPLLRALLQHVTARRNADAIARNDQTAGMLFYAVAKLRLPIGDMRAVLRHLLQLTRPHLPSYGPRHLAMIAWALGTVRWAEPRVFADIAAAFSPHVRSCRESELVMLAWALARVRHSDGRLMEEVAEAALRLLPGMSAQSLTNVVWAAAVQQVSHPGLWQELRAAALRSAHEWSPMDLVQATWAFAKQAKGGPLQAPLARKLASCVLQVLPRCEASQVVLATWAFAAMGYYDQALFQALATATVPLVDQMNPRLLSMAAWAYATAAHYDGPLLDSLFSALTRALPHAPPQSLSIGLWAAAVLAHPAPALFAAATPHLPQQLEHYNLQALSNIAYAYALTERCELPLMRAIFERAADCCADMRTFMNRIHMRQLAQAIITLDDHGHDLSMLLPSQLHATAMTAWSARTKSIRVSQFQWDVHDALKGLQLQPTIEALTSDGLFFVDVGVRRCGMDIAVEVDGPVHYSQSRPPHPLGQGLWLRRRLAARGWRVVTVPFFEWGALRGPVQQQQFLLGKLSEETGCGAADLLAQRSAS